MGPDQTERYVVALERIASALATGFDFPLDLSIGKPLKELADNQTSPSDAIESAGNNIYEGLRLVAEAIQALAQK